MVFRSIVYFLTIQTSFAIYCQNDYNNPVDWYILYKFPRLFSNDSLKYSIMTSEKSDWNLSEFSIDSNMSALGKTLEPLYDDERYLSWIFYGNKSSKGILIFEQKQSIVFGNFIRYFPPKIVWIVHNLPQFPNIEQYTFPEDSKIYGNTFLCISLPFNQLNNVGSFLKSIDIDIYSSKLSEQIESDFPILLELNQNSNSKFIGSILSILGTSFTLITKGFMNVDLFSYSSKFLQTQFYAQSWFEINNHIRSNRRVQNVLGNSIDSRYEHFTTFTDKSIWSVSSNNDSWFCIGDLNRQISNKNENGGVICLNNVNVSRNFRSIIKYVESIES